MHYAAILKNISASDLKNTLPPNGSPTQKNFCDFRIGRFRKFPKCSATKTPNILSRFSKDTNTRLPLHFGKNGKISERKCLSLIHISQGILSPARASFTAAKIFPTCVPCSCSKKRARNTSSCPCFPRPNSL